MTVKNESALASAKVQHIDQPPQPAYDPATDPVLHVVGLLLFMVGCVVCGGLLLS